MAEFSTLTIPGPTFPVTVDEWQGIGKKYNDLVTGLNNVMTFDDGRKNMILSNGPTEGKLYLMDTNHHIRSNRNHGITISTFPNLDALTIKQGSGNVGIGTSTPSEKLEVRGGNVLVNYGDGGKVFFKDPHHFIGVDGGSGLRLGTYGAPNGLVIQDSTGNVGIGTDDPKRKLHVVGDGIRLAKPGTSDHYIDIRADGSALDIDSSKELFINNSGKKVYIKVLDFTDFVGEKFTLRNGFSIGSKTTSAGLGDANEIKLVISNATTDLVFINQYGGVAINGHLRVKDFITSKGNVVVSDKRLKKDIADISFSLNQFLKLRPVIFRFNGKLGFNSVEDEVGLIAQEVQEIFPSLIATDSINKDDNTLENGNYLKIISSSLIYYAIAAIKELNQKVEQLKEKLLEVKTQ